MFLERFNVVMKAVEITEYWLRPLTVAGGLIIYAYRDDIPILRVVGLPPSEYFEEIEFESNVFPSDETYSFYDIKAVYNENENAVYFVIHGKDINGHTLSELHCLDISNFTVEGIESFHGMPLLAYDKLNKSVYVIAYERKLLEGMIEIISYALLRIKRKNVVSVKWNFIPKFIFSNVIGTRIGDDMILLEKDKNLIYITNSVFDNPKKALFLTSAETKTIIHVFGFDKENLIGVDAYTYLLTPYKLCRYVPAYDKEIEGIVFVCAGGITFSGYCSLYDVSLYSPERPDITIGDVVDAISEKTSAKNFIYRITNESNSRVIVYTSGLATYIVDKGGSRDIVVPVGSYLTLYSEKEAVINIELYLD